MITFQVAFLKFNAYKSSNLNSILYKPVFFSFEKQKPLQFFFCHPGCLTLKLNISIILINEIKGYYVAEWSRGDRYAVHVMTVTCFQAICTWFILYYWQNGINFKS